MPNALVTGCSSGFGLLAAVELARSGFRVFATLRTLDRRSALDEAAKSASVTLDVLQLDVLSEQDIASAQNVLDLSGGLEVLVNNAGFGLAGFAHDVSLDEFREQFETNFFAPVALTKAFLPGMIKRRRGRIINVSSLNGRVAMPGVSAYSASKFALEGFTEALRMEIAPFGLFASLIEPGTYRTEIFERNRREAKKMRDPASPWAPILAEMEAVVNDRIARSKGDPREVALAIRSAAMASRPRLRYLVGADAHAVSMIQRALPVAWFGKLVARTSKIAKLA